MKRWRGDFGKFLMGGYWNDPDSNAVGGRETLLFCWLMVLIGTVMPAVLVVQALVLK